MQRPKSTQLERIQKAATRRASAIENIAGTYGAMSAILSILVAFALHDFWLGVITLVICVMTWMHGDHIVAGVVRMILSDVAAIHPEE